MLRNLALLVLVVILGVALSRAFDQPPAAALKPVVLAPQSYAPAPDFAFTALDGSAHRLADYRGKAVLLNFWASWCVPCRVEFPQLIALAKARGEPLVILALSVDSDEAAMHKFLAQYDLPENFVVARDADKAVSAGLYQTLSYPETILIDPMQQMRRKFQGIEMPWDGAAFGQLLDTVLAR